MYYVCKVTLSGGGYFFCITKDTYDYKARVKVQEFYAAVSVEVEEFSNTKHGTINKYKVI